MQIVSSGDDLHEMLNPVFWKNKKNIIILSSAVLAKRVVKIKQNHPSSNCDLHSGL